MATSSSAVPDEQFHEIDLPPVPEYENVIVGAGFLGHGFKFTSVVDEILTDLTVDTRTDHPSAPFHIDRFN